MSSRVAAASLLLVVLAAPAAWAERAKPFASATYGKGRFQLKRYSWVADRPKPGREYKQKYYVKVGGTRLRVPKLLGGLIEVFSLKRNPTGVVFRAYGGPKDVQRIDEFRKAYGEEAWKKDTTRYYDSPVKKLIRRFVWGPNSR